MATLLDNGAWVQNAPDRLEVALRDRVRTHYFGVNAAFRALDCGNNGYVSSGDFVKAVRRVFLPTWDFSSRDIADLGRRIDLNKDGFISYNEFAIFLEDRSKGRRDEAAAAASVEPPRRRGGGREDEINLAIQTFKDTVERRFGSLREAFLHFLKGGSASACLSSEELLAVFQTFGMNLEPRHMEVVLQRFDEDGTGFITYPLFCRAMSSRPRFAPRTRSQRIPARDAARGHRHASASQPPDLAPRGQKENG